MDEVVRQVACLWLHSALDRRSDRRRIAEGEFIIPGSVVGQVLTSRQRDFPIDRVEWGDLSCADKRNRLLRNLWSVLDSDEANPIPFTLKVEMLAEKVYHADGFTILVGDRQTSWIRDREDVRDRYRKIVLEAINDGSGSESRGMDRWSGARPPWKVEKGKVDWAAWCARPPDLASLMGLAGIVGDEGAGKTAAGASKTRA